MEVAAESRCGIGLFGLQALSAATAIYHAAPVCGLDLRGGYQRLRCKQGRILLISLLVGAGPWLLMYSRPCFTAGPKENGRPAGAANRPRDTRSSTYFKLSKVMSKASFATTVEPHQLEFKPAGL